MSTESMSEMLKRLQKNPDRLLAVAQAATAGPWLHGRTSDRHGARLYVTSKAEDEGWIIEPVGHMEPGDAKYIATFDPPTVLGLLFALAQLKQAVEHLDEHQAIVEKHRRKREQLERAVRRRAADV